MGLSTLWHRYITHRFGWQHGQVVTAWHGGDLWVGYQCNICGEVTGAHITPIGRLTLGQLRNFGTLEIHDAELDKWRESQDLAQKG